jgi:hypothetical protein
MIEAIDKRFDDFGLCFYLALNSSIHSLVQSLYCPSNVLCHGHGTNNRSTICPSFPHHLRNASISYAPYCHQWNIWRHQTPPLPDGLQSLWIELYVLTGSFEDGTQADTERKRAELIGK